MILVYLDARGKNEKLELVWNGTGKGIRFYANIIRGYLEASWWWWLGSYEYGCDELNSRKINVDIGKCVHDWVHTWKLPPLRFRSVVNPKKLILQSFRIRSQVKCACTHEARFNSLYNSWVSTCKLYAHRVKSSESWLNRSQKYISVSFIFWILKCRIVF